MADNNSISETSDTGAIMSTASLRCLWFAIIIGSAFRFIVPFFNGPFDNAFSDFLRHYQNALDINCLRIETILDQPCYTYWLRMVLGFTGTSKFAMSVYAGFMSAVTPWLWYRWFRECLPCKKLALIGYAIFCILPSQIRIFSFFAQETLLLPLLALSLWISWSAVRKKSVAQSTLAAAVWGVTSLTRPGILPIQIIVVGWMMVMVLRCQSKLRQAATSAVMMALMISIYLIAPLRIYDQIGVFEVQPLKFSQTIFESRSRVQSFRFIYRQKGEASIQIRDRHLGNPSTNCAVFAPFNGWNSSRAGTSDYTVDFTAAPSDRYPKVFPTLHDRFESTAEDFIFFWFAPVWPIDFPVQDANDFSTVSNLGLTLLTHLSFSEMLSGQYPWSFVRWIWFPLTIAIVITSVRRRRISLLVLLTVVYPTVCVLQQSYVLESRYRIPWEGIAIAACLSLFAGKQRELRDMQFRRLIPRGRVRNFSTIFLALSPLIVSMLFPQIASARTAIAGADPEVKPIGKRYWLYPTSPKKTDRLFSYSSTNLHRWERHGPVLKLKDLKWVEANQNVRDELWAPSIFERDGLCFLYYSVGPQAPNHPSRIGVAVSPKPGDRFIDSGEALVTGGHGWEAIDPMVFADSIDGESYLYCGGSDGSALHVFRLDATLTRVEREMPIDTPVCFTEGAFMHKVGNIYYLSYSFGHWDDESYSVHYSTAPSALGPWTYKGKILQSDANHAGPGHHGFFKNPSSNQWYIVYHRWNNAIRNGKFPKTRTIAIQEISYADNGDIEPICLSD